MKNILKTKPRYSNFENYIYLLKNMWNIDKMLFLLSFLQAPLTVVIPLIGIYIPKVIIDSVSNNLSTSKLIINMGVPILSLIILNLVLNVSASITNVRGVSYRAKNTQKITNKVLDTDYENIDGTVGQQKIEKALMGMQLSDLLAVVKINVELFANIIGFIFYSGIIATIHPFILLFLGLSSLINYFLGNKINSFEHKNKDNIVPIERKLKYINKKTGEFHAAKDMRLYNMYPWFKEMFNVLKKERRHFEKKNTCKRYLGNLVDGLLIFLRDGITYGFLIHEVMYSGMSIGNFVFYFGVIAGFSAWLSGIVKNFNSLNSMSLAVCDLREYLDMEDKMNRESGVELPMGYELPCDIEIRNLYYKYPEAEDYTINNMNINIKGGEKIALVGVNGAGKTTLIKLICGLYTPTEGEIFINGKRSNLYNRDDYYSLFSVVFQDLHLLPFSIEKNITMQSEENIDKEKLDKVINMAGLESKIKDLPSGKKTLLVKSIYKEAIDLSGGEIQKLILARALYKDAPIIILDEPTAALDPIAENEIYEKYNELTKEHTSIFISHRLSSTRFCDRILFMENGCIVEEGNHNILMERCGRYKEMYDMQSYYYKDNIGGEKYA